MAISFPQHDKPTGLPGASDMWDMDLGGTLLRLDYFETPPDEPEPPDPEPGLSAEYLVIRRRRR